MIQEIELCGQWHSLVKAWEFLYVILSAKLTRLRQMKSLQDFLDELSEGQEHVRQPLIYLREETAEHRSAGRCRGRCLRRVLCD